jgi:integrase
MAKGIYRGKYGLRVIATVRRLRREHHIKYGTADAYEKAAAWQDEARTALRKLPQPASGRGGSFGADVKTYLQHVKPLLAPATYRSRVCELDAYLAEFRARPRREITRALLLELRTAWLTKEPGKRTGQVGVTPKTVRNREGALRHLYHTLDGQKAPTPLDDLPPLPKTPAAPQFVSVAVIRRVLKRLTDPKTRARFMVLATTGQRPAQLKRAEHADVDLRRRVWMIRSAKGGNPIPLVLTDDMVIAFKALHAAHAWGAFDGSDYAKALYAAGWPTDVRPYNAKHTMAITLAEAGAEWEDIKDWFGHRDVKSTRIYTGLVVARLKGTSKKLAGRFGWK